MLWTALFAPEGHKSAKLLLLIICKWCRDLPHVAAASCNIFFVVGGGMRSVARAGIVLPNVGIGPLALAQKLYIKRSDFSVSSPHPDRQALLSAPLRVQ